MNSLPILLFSVSLTISGEPITLCCATFFGSSKLPLKLVLCLTYGWLDGDSLQLKGLYGSLSLQWSLGRGEIVDHFSLTILQWLELFRSSLVWFAWLESLFGFHKMKSVIWWWLFTDLETRAGGVCHGLWPYMACCEWYG